MGNCAGKETQAGTQGKSCGEKMKACCIRFWDRNNDGKVDVGEVFETVKDATDQLGKISQLLTVFLSAYSDNEGVKEALQVLEKAKAIIDATENVADVLKKIKIPSDLSRIGDLDSDGDRDVDDMKIFLGYAEKICEGLEKANVDEKLSTEAKKALEEFQKLEGVLDKITLAANIAELEAEPAARSAP